MKKNIHRILLAACCCILPITNSVSASTTNKAEHLINKNGMLTDANGRTVILNGLNHVNKNKSEGYLNVNDEELFKKFKSWGFNCIRYGIIWDGLEPEPGKINEAYLKEIDKRVKWAEENGIWLMLDMHQDLYGQAFSDGAPAWATLTNNAPHYKGNIWSEAYLISPAVQIAFDNFWKNAPAPDGIGIQDHYINAWKVVADRYKDAPAVLGFDIMNEPFPGTQAQEVMGNLLTSAASMVYDISGM
ncbi:MAG: glycoside hydrolase family 5 protein, partial [Tannerellaceae bacterium]